MCRELLQIIQECFDAWNVDLLETQSFRSNSLHITAESEQESEHVAAGLDGIGADIPLRGQIVCQKVRHVDGEIGRFHGSTLRGMTSPKRSEERRVGKECRSRWSPDH